jgi:hypothetical protein
VKVMSVLGQSGQRACKIMRQRENSSLGLNTIFKLLAG